MAFLVSHIGPIPGRANQVLCLLAVHTLSRILGSILTLRVGMPEKQVMNCSCASCRNAGKLHADLHVSLVGLPDLYNQQPAGWGSKSL